MALETATYINDLVTTNPTGADSKAQGDDHLRLVKSVLKTSLPNVTRAFNLTRSAEYSDSSESKTANYTVLTADLGKIITMDASGGNRIFTLPDPATDAPAGWAVYLGRSDSAANSVTVNRSGAATINGATSLTIDGQYDFVFLKSDGTNWLALYVTGKLGGGLKGIFAQLAASNTFTESQTISRNSGAFLTITTDDSSSNIRLNGDRSASFAVCGDIQFAWDNTVIARIRGLSGVDTTNKDEGGLSINTVNAGVEAERVRVHQEGGVTIGAGQAQQGVGTLSAQNGVYDVDSRIHAVQDGLGTAIATTSGTAHDVTGIRADARRITLGFSKVSTNGTSVVIIQLGDAGGFETTGYSGSASEPNTNLVWPGNGIRLLAISGAVVAFSGVLILMLLDPTTNLWAIGGNFARTDTNQAHNTGGEKALSATLTQLRLTTVNGTDTFDAGAFNALIE